MSGEPKYADTPRAEIQFYCRILNAQITSGKDASRRITKATQNQNYAGREMQGIRVSLRSSSGCGIPVFVVFCIPHRNPGSSLANGVLEVFQRPQEEKT